MEQALKCVWGSQSVEGAGNTEITVSLASLSEKQVNFGVDQGNNKQ